MTTLAITRGLPACGKTTWAREWVEHDPTDRVRAGRTWQLLTVKG